MKDPCLIKVERSDMEAVKRLLSITDINYEIPRRFELKEYFESKINNQ